jgi:hypothetical protein
MTNAPLIICEKSGRWALSLRAVLRGTLPLVQTRSLVQCAEALAAAPAAMVALAISPQNVNAAVEWVTGVRRNFPATRVLALLEPEALSAEPLLREAGAADVFHSPQQATAIARLAQRHAALAPALELPLRENIAARLPWSAWATPGFPSSLSPSQD